MPQKQRRSEAQRPASLARSAPVGAAGVFKPVALPAVAAAVSACAEPRRRKPADRDVPAILRDHDFVD